MKMRRLSLLGALSLGVACGENNNNNGDLGLGSGGASATGGVDGTPASGGADTGTGGSASGGGPAGTGATNSGGAPSNSGGASPGSGGSAGGAMAAFQCPDGSQSLVPSLTGKQPTPIDGVPEIVNNGGFLEGPVWYEGKLFVSQVDFSGPPPSGSILVYTPGAGFSPFVSDVGTNGLALGGDGRLYATTMLNAGVISFNAANASEAPKDVARMYNGKVFNSPNDITVRSDGTVYFTDPSHNCGSDCGQSPVNGVYRVPPGGAAELITTTQNQPNGIALSPDEKILYVGGTSLTAHPVMADGSVGAGTPFGDKAYNTDGLAVDCAGNLYLALYSEGKIVVLSSAGVELAGSLAVSEVTNLAFGGPESKTLFITSFGDNRGQLRSVDLEVPGFPF